jgi:hypothetical protein
VSQANADDCLTDLLEWSTLAVYAAVWIAGLGLGLGGEWQLVVGVAATYVGMHAFEMRWRNHCFLSADSTAVPVSLAVFSATILGLWAAGRPPWPEAPLVLAWSPYGAVLILGHLAALAYFAALGLALDFLLRRRRSGRERA